MDLECNVLVDHHSWELVPYQSNSNIILVDSLYTQVKPK